MTSPRWLSVSLALACLSVAGSVRADCAQGSNYQVTVKGRTVTVGLDQTTRTCGDPGGMMREDEATGDVVLLANFCGTGEFGESAYVDECVPPGTYRYGLAAPYDCSEPGCGGVDVFQEATVTAPPDPSCARAASDPGPTATTVSPPWETGAEPTQAKSCPTGGLFCSAATTTVVSMNAAAVGAGLVAFVVASRLRRRRAK